MFSLLSQQYQFINNLEHDFDIESFIIRFLPLTVRGICQSLSPLLCLNPFDHHLILHMESQIKCVLFIKDSLDQWSKVFPLRILSDMNQDSRQSPLSEIFLLMCFLCNVCPPLNLNESSTPNKNMPSKSPARKCTWHPHTLGL